MTLPLLPEQQELENSFITDLSESLGEVDFAESLPENATPEQLDRSAPALLRFLLQSGEGGYKDSIDLITDDEGNPPSEANGWLWDDEEGAFIGRFTDARPGDDRIFMFRIERSGDSWLRSFQPIGEGE